MRWKVATRTTLADIDSERVDAHTDAGVPGPDGVGQTVTSQDGECEPPWTASRRVCPAPVRSGRAGDDETPPGAVRSGRAGNDDPLRCDLESRRDGAECRRMP